MFACELLREGGGANTEADLLSPHTHPMIPQINTRLQCKSLRGWC